MLHSLKKLRYTYNDLVLRYKIGLALLVSLILSSSLPAVAQEDQTDWWFDVEVIAFKRTGNETQLTEDFSKAMFDFDTQLATDLISPELALQYRHQNDFYMGSPCQAPNIIELDIDFPPILPALPALLSSQRMANDSALNDTNTNTSNASDNLNEVAPPLPDNISFCSPYISRITKLKQKLGFYESEYSLVNYTEFFQKLPIRIDAQTQIFQGRHYLLTNEDLSLQDLAETLFKQRNISPLLHFAWRQPVVFGEDNADFYRVFAGERFKYTSPSLSYEALEQKYSTQLVSLDDELGSDFFERLQQSLEQNNQVDWAKIEKLENTAQNDGEESVASSPFEDSWELDGQIKVYLRNINGIPYLHLDNEFMLSSLAISASATPELKQFPFKQKRRIISKQVHYFDHPKFGLIIRLERFTPPIEPESDLDSVTVE